MIHNPSLAARSTSAPPLQSPSSSEWHERSSYSGKPPVGETYPGFFHGDRARRDPHLSLYEVCRDLFSEYPLAVNADDHDWIHSIVLMLEDVDEDRFFVLLRDHSTGRSRYSLRSWRGESAVDIKADGGTAVPDVFAEAVTGGVPIPQDGSLFGWKSGDAITALITFYAAYTPVCPEPSWSVMPLAGTSEAQWPPFTGERLLGHWFWEHHRAGSAVSLGDLIARTPGVVFWTYTEAIFESGCCIVMRDIEAPEGYTLQRGCYVYDQVLRAHKPVPLLDTLFNDYGKIDLAGRF